VLRTDHDARVHRAFVHELSQGLAELAAG
jgi:hypothetical protein